MYAGLKQNVAVCSFEPLPAKLYLLAANVRANNIQTIVAYPFGMLSGHGVIKWQSTVSPVEAVAECQIDRLGNLAFQV